MKTDRIIAGALVGLCFASIITGFLFQRTPSALKGNTTDTSSVISWGESTFSGKSADIAVIDIAGPIMYGEAGGFNSSGASANQLLPILNKIEKDGIKGVLLRLNSPGGTASASQAIYEKIMSMRKNKKIKFYSFMQDVAASGAYYIASACDVIYANPSTLTGSIGVIMQVPNYTELSNKVGIQTITIKSGKFKDIGNGARKMTDDEKSLLQILINDTYGEFVKAVSNGRKMPESRVRELADGRIYTGNQAKANKLIDKLGTEEDTINDLAQSIGVDGDPKLKNYTKPSWEKLFDMNAKSPLSGTILESPEFSASFNKIPLMLYK